MKRKLINPRNIGDKVTIFSTVDFIYEDHPGNKVKRAIIRRNLETPLVGVITGGSYKPTGTVNSGHETYSYEGDIDYDPGYLAIDKVHFVYTVKLGLLNTDYYALPGDLLTNLGSHKIPVKYAPPPEWCDLARDNQRKEMKDVPRDSKGRWMKQSGYTVTSVTHPALQGNINNDSK